MMLVINTAFKTANLAVVTDKIYSCDIDSNSKHSENVLPTIEKLLDEAGIDVLDIDTVALVTGPGSFTGLRIGAAIARALGSVNKKIKFISLSSLSLMAYIIAKHKLVKGNFVCAINALSGLYFVGTYDQNGINIEEEKMIDSACFEKITLPKFAFADDIDGLDSVTCDNKSLVDFAKSEESAKHFVSLEELLPRYLRLSQAEDNLIKKSKKV